MRDAMPCMHAMSHASMPNMTCEPLLDLTSEDPPIADKDLKVNRLLVRVLTELRLNKLDLLLSCHLVDPEDKKVMSNM